ncbi:MAG TPA: acyl-CoA dehydrogenase, partial [Mycobacterium sp.]|nr:acyl-CoA dehydrogenase [Mycobacterium sp.]
MPIAIKPEHQDLAESVRALLNRVAPAEVLHEALETPISNPPPFWRAAADQGLHGLHLSESVGGQGYGMLELAVAVAEFGHGAVPGPFIPSVIASALIAAHDPESKLLAELASGETIAAAALESDLTGTQVDGTLTIRGECRCVPAGAQASLLVLPVSIENTVAWVVLDAAQLQIEEWKSVDPLRPVARIRADGAEVSTDRVLSAVPHSAGRAIITTLLSAEAVGIALWATETASEYAKIREQFGRPIGQFQAIKHKCAEMIATTERATAAVWDAARAIDEAAANDWGDASTHYQFAAAVAATLAPVAAQHCAQDCIQVHGGIGFTWEHDAHLYLRRAFGIAQFLGGESRWLRRVVELTIGGVRRDLHIDLDSVAHLRSGISDAVSAVAALPAAERQPALADSGLLAPHWPKPYGRGAGPAEQLLIDAELAKAGVVRPDLVIGWWAGPTILEAGTREQIDRFVPATLRGEIFWCQLFSEPEAGSDLAALRTKAVRVEGGWKLNGQKVWTSAAHKADWGVCLARTDPDAPKHKGITYFLVDMRLPGIMIRPLREITG